MRPPYEVLSFIRPKQWISVRSSDGDIIKVRVIEHDGRWHIIQFDIKAKEGHEITGEMLRRISLNRIDIALNVSALSSRTQDYREQSPPA